MANTKKDGKTQTENLKLVPIRKEAEKWGTTSRNIINWIKKGKISGSRIGDTWGVEKNSIAEYLKLNAKISSYNKILEEKIKEKEEAIKRFNNEIYIINNLYELTPAFQLVLFEMSTLLSDPEHQVIFLDMFLGREDIDTIAEKHYTTPDKILYIQKANVKAISQKSNFLKDYRNRLKELKLTIRKLEIHNTNKKEAINTIYKLLPEEMKKKVSPYVEKTLNPEIVNLLSKPINEILTDQRCINCLLYLELYTVEDLIRFLKINKDYNIFLRVRNFGPKTLKRLKLELHEKKLVKTNGESDLYKYV